MFRLSGIFRDVYLWSTAPGHIRDVEFRTVEIRGGRLLVNGQAILVKGVNRHEHSPDLGH